MIVIATPAKEKVSAEFTMDLVDMIQYGESDVKFITSLGTMLPNQRTDLVHAAQGLGATHILFIDSDMRFPANALTYLRDKEIIGANYKQRRADKWSASISSKGKRGVEEVDYIGFGFCLIAMSVFEHIEEPWFAFPWDTENRRFVSDDVFLCEKARQTGIETWVDHDLSQKVRHIGTKEF